MCFRQLLVLTLLTSAQPGFAASRDTAAAKPIEFNRDIRPILSDNCFACHGPDDNKRKAKLRLDRKEDAFKPAKSGDLAIVPGDTAKTNLFNRTPRKKKKKKCRRRKAARSLIRSRSNYSPPGVAKAQ